MDTRTHKVSHGNTHTQPLLKHTCMHSQASSPQCTYIHTHRCHIPMVVLRYPWQRDERGVRYTFIFSVQRTGVSQAMTKHLSLVCMLMCCFPLMKDLFDSSSDSSIAMTIRGIRDLVILCVELVYKSVRKDCSPPFDFWFRSCMEKPQQRKSICEYEQSSYICIAAQEEFTRRKWCRNMAIDCMTMTWCDHMMVSNMNMNCIAVCEEFGEITHLGPHKWRFAAARHRTH